MSCGSCGTKSADGKPSGCQSNGGCSSGGCNRLNVFNWLADIPLSDIGKPFPIVEISFNNGSRKDFFKNDTNAYYEKGMMLAVEGSNGFDVGQVSLTGELVKLQMKKHNVKETDEIKNILRIANENDINAYYESKDKEKSILIRGRAIAKTLNLEMKIAEAELQADGKKVCFFYTADARVDFRELIKVYATEFKTKIEMRQIGARQESSKVGGIGSCGRELCCSSWLTDFKTVNTTAARYQNLSINQAKLSGQCGRLKCCLNFELDTYMDALKVFPEQVEHLQVSNGRAYLIKKDIFRNLIWYGMPGSSRQYPMTIERVEEISSLNKKGIIPDELGFEEEVQTRNKNVNKTVDVGFINDVGQITLSALTKSNKKKKPTNNGSNGGNKAKNLTVNASANHPKNDKRGLQQNQSSKPKPPKDQQQGKNQHSNEKNRTSNIPNTPKDGQVLKTSGNTKEAMPNNQSPHNPKNEGRSQHKKVRHSNNNGGGNPKNHQNPNKGAQTKQEQNNPPPPKDS